MTETLEVFGDLLCGDDNLAERTIFSVEEIFKFSRLVLSSCYSQRDESLGPVVANLFMRNFKRIARQRSIALDMAVPRLWIRYEDDILLLWDSLSVEFTSFEELLNGIHLSICFSTESEQNGKLPFSDIVIKTSDRRVSYSVCRKLTRTGRYLHRNSHRN